MEMHKHVTVSFGNGIVQESSVALLRDMGIAVLARQRPIRSLGATVERIARKVYALRGGSKDTIRNTAVMELRKACNEFFCVIHVGKCWDEFDNEGKNLKIRLTLRPDKVAVSFAKKLLKKGMKVPVETLESFCLSGFVSSVFLLPKSKIIFSVTNRKAKKES